VTVTVTPTWRNPRIDGGSPLTVAVTVSMVRFTVTVAVSRPPTWSR
jgi:hypothetical protein